jgi:HAD superfamily phosphoserine phosphatase-like hydrolase
VKLSLWDMDRTLTRVPSFPRWLMHWVRHEAPWRALLLPAVPVLLLLFGIGALDRGGLKAGLQWLFMGPRVVRARLALRAEAFAATWGAGAELKPALARLAADRAEGYLILLVTASPHYYVEALGRRWGVDAVLATANAGDETCVFHRLEGANCYGAEKPRRVAAWLGGRVPSVVRAYSDHVSDVPLLEMAVGDGGGATAANPTRAMQEEAARRGWPVVSWF